MTEIRRIIREAIRESVTISEDDVLAALEQIDISFLVTDAVQNTLREYVERTVGEELGDAVAEAIGDMLD